MKTLKNIENLFKKINLETNPNTDDAVLDDVLKTFGNSKQTHHQLNITTIFMKSRICPNFDPEKEIKDMGYIEVSPRMHRDGHFYDRKRRAAWYEYKGRAWRYKWSTYAINHFKDDFKQVELRENQLNTDILETLRTPRHTIALNKQW